MIEIYLFIVGLAFGSFVTAFTWRLHTKKNFISDRSQCESCGHKLNALDLIPFFSWLFLGGRCRYCSKPIGWHNPVLELTMASLFVVSYIFWPLGFDAWQSIVLFVMWLAYLVMLVSLVVYDFRWMILPNGIVFSLIALSFIDLAIRLSLYDALFITNYIFSAVSGAAVIGGLYGLLYFVSKGKWVGFGDVKLGIFMGVVLGWQSALLALFLANMIGFVYVLPGLLMKKLNKSSRVPFGPFLIAGFIIAGIFGKSLIDWYVSLVIGQ